MRIEDTTVQGVKLLTPEQIRDERGFFARTWAQDLFEECGLCTRVVQRNLSYNRQVGTLRGMHFQRAPYAEVKLVSCVVGAIFDVAVDLRRESPSFGKWFGVELRADTESMLYIPEGCAHGYLSLMPDATVEYLVSEFYHPQAAAGVRWNDPYFGVRWPAEPQVIAERDRTYPDFTPFAAECMPG